MEQILHSILKNTIHVLNLKLSTNLTMVNLFITDMLLLLGKVCVNWFNNSHKKPVHVKCKGD